MWIELTVAFMPSSRITATTCAICAGVEVRELAVVDRDVGDAAGAVARQRAAGHLAQHARGGGLEPHGIAAHASTRPARTRSTSLPSSVNSATAPFSATIASSGQVSAKPRLQPIGRPVTAITGTPAARRSCSAASASGSIRPSRVNVSSMSVRRPRTCAGRGARQAAQRGGSRRAHRVESCTRPRWTAALRAGYNSVQFRGALQGRTRSQARNSSLQPRSPARSPWVRVLNLIGVLWRVLV